MNKKNTIFLISGPSGVGKDTVIKTLNESNSNEFEIIITHGSLLIFQTYK